MYEPDSTEHPTGQPWKAILITPDGAGIEVEVTAGSKQDAAARILLDADGQGPAGNHYPAGPSHLELVHLPIGDASIFVLNKPTDCRPNALATTIIGGPARNRRFLMGAALLAADPTMDQIRSLDHPESMHYLMAARGELN